MRATARSRGSSRRRFGGVPRVCRGPSTHCHRDERRHPHLDARSGCDLFEGPGAEADRGRRARRGRACPGTHRAATGRRRATRCGVRRDRRTTGWHGHRIYRRNNPADTAVARAMSTDVDTQRPLLELVASQNKAVLATVKHDGRPQLSTSCTRGIRTPASPGSRSPPIARRPATRRAIPGCHARECTRLLELRRRRGRCGPVHGGRRSARRRDRRTRRRLPDGHGREHEDWEEFRRAMVDERRQVLRVRTDHLYGMAQLP